MGTQGPIKKLEPISSEVALQHPDPTQSLPVPIRSSCRWSGDREYLPIHGRGVKITETHVLQVGAVGCRCIDGIGGGAVQSGCIGCSWGKCEMSVEVQ